MGEPGMKIGYHPVVDMSTRSSAVEALPVFAPTPSKQSPAKTTRKICRHRDSERGAALVELALTIPILMIIVLGMCGFAFVFNQYLELTEATNVAVEQISFSRGASNTDVCKIAYTAASQISPALKPANMIFTIVANGVTGVTSASGSANVTCNGAAMQSAITNGLGTPATVTIQYAVSTPFTFNLGSLYKFNPLPGFTMQAQVTEMIQ